MTQFLIMITALSPDPAARPGLAIEHAVGPAGVGEVLAGSAESAHWQHLQPFPRDRLGTALADSVRALVESLQRGVDLRQGPFGRQRKRVSDLEAVLICIRHPLRGLQREFLELFAAEASLLVQLLAKGGELTLKLSSRPGGGLHRVDLLAHGLSYLSLMAWLDRRFGFRRNGPASLAQQ